MGKRAVRIGVDTGGTFTDLVLDLGTGAPFVTHKLLSTPADPAKAVLAGIRAVLAKWAGAGAYDVRPDVLHGSTVATNALLEGAGEATAFVTTAGFEDTLWLGRQNRPRLYELEPRRQPLPLADGAALGARERVLRDGRVLTPLRPAAIDELLAALAQAEVSSIALSLLHSYANPRHEQLLAEAIRQRMPHVHLTVSHELLPEFREYERAATCLANAVVAPQMSAYLARLREHLGPQSFRIMSSAGGSLPAEVVLKEPVRTILSGPAGGVVGALAAARAGGFERIITLDMGGTSTDVALCDGALTRTTESEIAGLPLRQPMIDIHTVGAGGGSCAWLDEGGALRVGPKSMGADPGPACYGIQAPPYTATVTDAHAVLGTLPANRALSGGLLLDRTAATAALERVSHACGLDLMETAAGILRVVETTMARAIQRISVERGHDPRDFALVPFGGAGGLHAARLADQLGLETVLVPTHPGLLSAWGMLGAAPLHTFSLGLMLRLDQAGARRDALRGQPDIERAIARLTAQADQAMALEGVSPAQRIYAAAADMRYQGQSYELTVPLGQADPLELFTRRHAQLYGYIAPGKPLEVTTVRLEATCAAPSIQLPALPQRGRPVPPDLCEVLADGLSEGPAPTTFVERDDLLQGDALEGPAIVGEYSATTLVPAGWRLQVNELGQLVLRRAKETGGARGRA